MCKCVKRFYRVSLYGILKNNISVVEFYCELDLLILIVKKLVLKLNVSICFSNID